MANNPRFTDNASQKSVNAVAALMNGGYLCVYTGSQPTDANEPVTGTLLAKLALSATAFANATSAGSFGARVTTATANAITPSTGLASGTAGYFVIYKSDGATVVAMGSVGTTGADLNLNTTSITLGIPVSVSSGALTETET